MHADMAHLSGFMHLTCCAGAGDQFAAGFLYGVMRGYSMRKCAQLGCLAGGAVVQVVGAEMTPDSWRWVFARSALTTPLSACALLLPELCLRWISGLCSLRGSFEWILAQV